MSDTDADNKTDNSQDERLSEIIERVGDENLPIEEALQLLDEAINIGNDACSRASKILNTNA